MKKAILKLVVIMLIITTSVSAQNNEIKADYLAMTFKQIKDSLPHNWSVKADSLNPAKFIIQSAVIELSPDMTSNDPLVLKGKCEIFILTLPKISPDSINSLRKRNKELKEKLPPQVSKDSLKKWYTQNEKTLKLIDSEPTNYDNNYSYRISCRRLPKQEKDLADYNRIMAYLIRLYKKY